MSARLPDRHQAQRLFVRGQVQYPLHFGIIERADHDDAQIERHGLQIVDVLLSRRGSVSLITGAGLLVARTCSDRAGCCSDDIRLLVLWG